MSRLKVIVMGTIFIFTALLTLAWHLAASPWLLWHLLPSESDLRVISQLNHPTAHTVVRAINILPDSFDSSSVTVLGISRRGTTTTIAVVPKLRHYHEMNRHLIGSGWHTESYGRIIRASTTFSSSPRLIQALQDTALTLVGDRVPLTPMLIAESVADSTAFQVSGAVMMTQYDHALHVSAAETFAELQKKTGQTVKHNPLQKGVEIALPSDKLATIPIQFQNHLIEQLINQLHLTLPAAEVVAGVVPHQQLALRLIDQEGGLAISPPSERFRQTATTWLEDAERRQRPTTRSFRLPDGTLGREIVPGERQPVLAPPVNNCHAPLPGKSIDWICQTERATTLASSQEVAQQTERLFSNSWQISLDEPALTSLCQHDPTDPIRAIWCSFSRVDLAGLNPNHLAGRLYLR